MSLVGFRAQNHVQQVLAPRSHVDDRATEVFDPAGHPHTTLFNGPPRDIVLVRISLGKPKWLSNDVAEQFPYISELAPQRDLVSRGSRCISRIGGESPRLRRRRLSSFYAASWSWRAGRAARAGNEVCIVEAVAIQCRV